LQGFLLALPYDVLLRLAQLGSCWDRRVLRPTGSNSKSCTARVFGHYLVASSRGGARFW